MTTTEAPRPDNGRRVTEHVFRPSTETFSPDQLREIDAWAEKIAAAAPPLSPAQRARIYELLHPATPQHLRPRSA
jgi:hypothetical protein